MNKLAALQILRAVAALLVVVSHAILRQAEWAPTDPLTSHVAIYIGLLGVWIFFIISGFIMSYTYYDNFALHGAAGQFIASRIIRIVPIYWLATALEVALRLHHGAGLDVNKLICSLLFIPVAVEPGPMVAMRPTLGVGWTLNYEMMFYAAFASVLLLSRRKGLTVLIALMAGVVLTGTFFKPITDTRAPTNLIAFYSDPIILLFGIGVLIGAAARWLKNAPAVRSHAVLLIALAGFLVVDVTLFAAFVGTYPADVEWIAAFWVISAICVVLCVVVRTDDTRWLTRRLRATRGRILQPLSVPFLWDHCRGEALVVVLREKRFMDVRPRVCRRGHAGGHRDPSFRRAADWQPIATLQCVAQNTSICSTRSRPNSDEGDAW